MLSLGIGQAEGGGLHGLAIVEVSDELLGGLAQAQGGIVGLALDVGVVPVGVDGLAKSFGIDRMKEVLG